MLSSQLSFLIISSPSPNNPSLDMILSVLSSISLLQGCQCCKVLIVLDGYNIDDVARMKKGKVTAAMARAYEQYCENLKCLAGERSRVSVLRMDKHVGFAMGVFHGLQHIRSTFGCKYAVVMQHDRKFIREVSIISPVLELMEQQAHIRYVGFPTSASCNHNEQLTTRYRLSFLNLLGEKYRFESGEYLQPLVFWYDSNHICHIDRYLEIFKPLRNVPKQIFDRVGIQGIKSMLLRNGDFIEDKFGQFQRNLLVEISEEDSHGWEAEAESAFNWFGSFLLWIPASKIDVSNSPCNATVLVEHLFGRQTDDSKAAYWRSRGELNRQLKSANLELSDEAESYGNEDVGDAVSVLFRDFEIDS